MSGSLFVGHVAEQGYTIVIDPNAFDLGTVAYVRMNAMPGEVKRLAKMLDDTPEVVEADRVTGEDCFLAKLVVSDARELQAVVDRFQPYASADTPSFYRQQWLDVFRSYRMSPSEGVEGS